MKSKHLIVVLLLCSLFAILLSGCGSQSVQLIKPADLQNMIASKENFVLVDVREAADYNNGHIAQAVNMPASTFDQDYTKLKPGQKIVLICYSGETSQAAGQFLISKGYANVSSVQGGMEGWQGQVTK